MRRSDRKVLNVEEPRDIFMISLTPRQMQLINYLKSRGGKAYRRDLFWEFGPGVDNIACALLQKGILERKREGVKILYQLTKLGDV